MHKKAITSKFVFVELFFVTICTPLLSMKNFFPILWGLVANTVLLNGSPIWLMSTSRSNCHVEYFVIGYSFDGFVTN